MIRFDGLDYDETTFSPIALYNIHRVCEIKRAMDKVSQDLNAAITQTSIAQVSMEALMDLERHSNDVIRKELASVVPVEKKDVSGT